MHMVCVQVSSRPRRGAEAGSTCVSLSPGTTSRWTHHGCHGCSDGSRAASLAPPMSTSPSPWTLSNACAPSEDATYGCNRSGRHHCPRHGAHPTLSGPRSMPVTVGSPRHRAAAHAKGLRRGVEAELIGVIEGNSRLLVIAGDGPERDGRNVLCDAPDRGPAGSVTWTTAP